MTIMTMTIMIKDDCSDDYDDYNRMTTFVTMMTIMITDECSDDYDDNDKR